MADSAGHPGGLLLWQKGVLQFPQISTDPVQRFGGITKHEHREAWPLRKRPRVMVAGDWGPRLCCVYQAVGLGGNSPPGLQPSHLHSEGEQVVFFQLNKENSMSLLSELISLLHC